VTKKIAREAARIKRGLSTELRLGNLSAARDWGFAADAVLAMWLMLQADAADDFVIATGETHTVREFCEVAFRHVGLDYRDHVREDSAAFRPTETGRLVGDSSKARRCLGWGPTIRFEDLVVMMVDAELESLGPEGRKSANLEQ
jgi:GDPmannose 4,6-dehydratase